MVSARREQTSSDSGPNESGRRFRYQAFISYSHSADADLARALRDGIHRLGNPWYRLRAARVFLDEASMAANSDLWSTIDGKLADSEYLILLASPQAAGSQGVEEELKWWT